MQTISKILFGIANSLLIPDILLLIIFFLYALLLLGRTYADYMNRRKNKHLLDATIKELTPTTLPHLSTLLPQAARSPYTLYLTDLLQHPPTQAYADWLINRYETEATKDINTSRLLTKIGPVLGLIGTLISMSPALVGLSAGDISGMAYNMQVVFATTVVGLVISIIGLYTQQVKQRWYADDINNLDRVAHTHCQTLNEPTTHENTPQN